MREIFIISVFGLHVFACLYLSTGLLNDFGSIQLTHMLNWHDTSFGWYFHLIYTILLIFTTISIILNYTNPNKIAWVASVCFVALASISTIAPILISWNGSYQPSFYEYYLGEILTIACCIIALTLGYLINDSQQYNTNAEPATGRPR